MKKMSSIRATSCMDFERISGVADWSSAPTSDRLTDRKAVGTHKSSPRCRFTKATISGSWQALPISNPRVGAVTVPPLPLRGPPDEPASGT